jgi:splicing factor 3B subunit 4
MRDPETGNSKGFAFINFASFDAADAAIEAMNGQHLCNRPISISYAFKKDAKGERHGSAAGKYTLRYIVLVYTQPSSNTNATF